MSQDAYGITASSNKKDRGDRWRYKGQRVQARRVGGVPNPQCIHIAKTNTLIEQSLQPCLHTLIEHSYFAMLTIRIFQYSLTRDTGR